MSTPKPVILVVDDEADIRSILRSFLERLGYSVEEAGTGKEALTKAMALRPNAMLLDQRLPDFAGHEVYQHLVQFGLHIPTAFMSGFVGVDRMAKHYGVSHFLPKPIVFEGLNDLVLTLLAQPKPGSRGVTK